jgi:hypothetical protein
MADIVPKQRGNAYRGCGWYSDTLRGDRRPKCGNETKINRFIDERLLIHHLQGSRHSWQGTLSRGLPPPEEIITETLL